MINSSLSQNPNIIQLAQFPKYLGIQTEDCVPDQEIVLQSLEYLLHDNTGSQSYAKIYYRKQNYLCQKEGSQLQVAGSLIVTYQSSKVWWIRSAFVKKQFRGKGIFKDMFRQVCRKAEDINAKQIKLYVSRFNERAQKLYRTLGFQKTSQIFYFYEFSHEQSYDLFKKQWVRDKDYTISVNPIQLSEQYETIESLINNKSSHIQYHQTLCMHLSPGKQLISSQKHDFVVFCRYYTQFSDWQCGLILCISQLSIKKSTTTATHKIEQLKNKGILFLYVLTEIFEEIKKSQKNCSTILQVRTIRLIKSKIQSDLNAQNKQNLPSIDYINNLLQPLKFQQEFYDIYGYTIKENQVASINVQ